MFGILRPALGWAFLIVGIFQIPGAQAADPWEPNETGTQTSLVSPPADFATYQPWANAVLGVGDNDWYHLPASSAGPQWVSAWIEGVTEQFGSLDFDTVMEMRQGGNLSSVATNDDIRTSGIYLSGIATAMIPQDVSPALWIHGFQPADAGSYRLYTLAKPAGAGFDVSDTEPNDSPPTANSLTAEQNAEGDLNPGTGVDWFKVAWGDPDEEAMLVVLNNRTSGHDLQVEVFDQGGFFPLTGTYFDGGVGGDDYFVIPKGGHSSATKEFKVSSDTGSGSYRLTFGRGIPAQLYCGHAFAVPDNAPGGATDTLSIPSADIEIQDLDVRVKVTHPDVSELEIRLTHVSTGTSVQLLASGSCPGDADFDLTFDDESLLTICPFHPGGRVPPSGTLSAFDGEEIDGNWALNVIDNSGGNAGMVENWCLELNRASLVSTPTPSPTPTSTGTPTSTPTPTPTATSGFDCLSSPYTSSPSLAIPDNSSASDTIVITDTFDIDDVDVFVDISHPDPGRLSISLTHSTSGLRIPIYGDLGCSMGPDVFAVFDDEGIAQSCPPVSPNDSIVPANSNFPLSDFDNHPVQGTWTLEIDDVAAGDVGTLNRWCLIVTARGTPTPTPTLTHTPSQTPTATVPFDCASSPYTSSPGLAIPDDTGSASDTIVITETGIIDDLNVFVDINHERSGDLGVVLRHVETSLHCTLYQNIVCASSGGVFAVFDDEGAVQPCPPVSPGVSIETAGQGVNFPLDQFDGRDLQGTWILEVDDDAAGNLGTFNRWCLFFTLRNTPTPTETPTHTMDGGPTVTNTPDGPTSTPTLTNTPTETGTPTPTITPGGPTLTPSPTCANGPDLTGDGQVDAFDLLELLRQMRGTKDPNAGDADLNCDGTLTDRDLLEFERSWKP